jgi:hypothetical protein
MIKLFEKFAGIDEVKDEIFITAVKTGELNLVKFFIKKGYNINADGAIYQATYYNNVLKYFLENNANIETLNDDRNSRDQLSDDEVQKLLIDFGHDGFIHSTVGFNNEIKKYGKKYIDIIEYYKNMEKFNL